MFPGSGLNSYSISALALMVATKFDPAEIADREYGSRNVSKRQVTGATTQSINNSAPVATSRYNTNPRSGQREPYLIEDGIVKDRVRTLEEGIERDITRGHSSASNGARDGFLNTSSNRLAKPSNYADLQRSSAQSSGESLWLQVKRPQDNDRSRSKTQTPDLSRQRFMNLSQSAMSDKASIFPDFSGRHDQNDSLQLLSSTPLSAVIYDDSMEDHNQRGLRHMAKSPSLRSMSHSPLISPVPVVSAIQQNDRLHMTETQPTQTKNGDNPTESEAHSKNNPYHQSSHVEPQYDRGKILTMQEATESHAEMLEMAQHSDTGSSGLASPASFIQIDRVQSPECIVEEDMSDHGYGIPELPVPMTVPILANADYSTFSPTSINSDRTIRVNKPQPSLVLEQSGGATTQRSLSNHTNLVMTPMSPSSLLSQWPESPTATEVDQAKTVELYKHRQQSLLLVNQTVNANGINRLIPDASLSTLSLFPAVKHAANMTSSFSPDLEVNSRSKHGIKIPLLNSHVAPQTPLIRFIPPSPSNTSDQRSDRRIRGVNRSKSTNSAKSRPGRESSFLRKRARLTASGIYDVFTSGRTPLKEIRDDDQPVRRNTIHNPLVNGEYRQTSNALHPKWKPKPNSSPVKRSDSVMYESIDNMRDDIHLRFTNSIKPPSSPISTDDSSSISSVDYPFSSAFGHGLRRIETSRLGKPNKKSMSKSTTARDVTKIQAPRPSKFSPTITDNPPPTTFQTKPVNNKSPYVPSPKSRLKIDEIRNRKPCSNRLPLHSPRETRNSLHEHSPEIKEKKPRTFKSSYEPRLKGFNILKVLKLCTDDVKTEKGKRETSRWRI